MEIKLVDKSIIEFNNEDIVVTDPCYFIPDDIWSKLCDKDHWFPENYHSIEGWKSYKYGKMYLNDIEILYSSTAYGDGGYYVYANSERVGTAGVDAGMLCVIRKSDVERLVAIREETRIASEHMFVHIDNFSGYTQVDKKGNWIGDIQIKTD